MSIRKLLYLPPGRADQYARHERAEAHTSTLKLDGATKLPCHPLGPDASLIQRSVWASALTERLAPRAARLRGPHARSPRSPATAPGQYVAWLCELRRL